MALPNDIKPAAQSRLLDITSRATPSPGRRITIGPQVVAIPTADVIKDAYIRMLAADAQRLEKELQHRMMTNAEREALATGMKVIGAIQRLDLDARRIENEESQKMTVEETMDWIRTNAELVRSLLPKEIATDAHVLPSLKQNNDEKEQTPTKAGRQKRRPDGPNAPIRSDAPALPDDSDP